MATTDTKPGFRLPWGADRSGSGHGSGDATETPQTAPSPAGTDATDAGAAPAASEENETKAMIDAAPAATTSEAAVDAPTGTAATPRPAASVPASAAPTPGVGPRKANKFMADLTKAMQAAAESARTDTLERVGVEAKSVIEGIHAGSSTEATELRKRADDDVAAVREWSKQEIARIREETDERIAHRKARLEREIEDHAAGIEARIERVQQRVSAFEAEMGAFFERLLAEDDPTRFAALAESLPEPPPLDAEGSSLESNLTDAADLAAPMTPEPVAAALEPVPSPVAPETAEEPGVDETSGGPVPMHATAEPAAATQGTATPAAEPATASDVDPRLAMLGLDQDFAAAEAEALAYTPEDENPDDQIMEVGDDMIAARLAGIVTESEPTRASGATRVVVVGLVSVASIAGFKRHLSRVPGVGHVGVTSGPDGEFVFTVQHEGHIALRDVVPTLPGFGARVTAEAEGELTVTARDPETES